MSQSRRGFLQVTAAGVVLVMLVTGSLRGEPLPKDDGYRGIWYANQPSNDEYKYKYSGGLGTYPQQHIPIAVYSKEANKTFFCYGGTPKEKNELLHMVSWYDHATGQVPRPTILLNKKTTDAHDNPTLQIDDRGHIWIFSNAHGKSRPSYIHRSKKPWAIDEFELVQTTNFSYSQPWYFPGKGFLFLHTRYSPGRNLFWMTSPDGVQWSEPQPLARIEQGHYQVSWRQGDRLGTAFNFHPKQGGLNARTNLYYLESRDFGKTWQTVAGQPVQTPLAEVKNPALVRDFQSEKLLVYLKDVQFDAQGHPVLLYLTSKGYASGPENDPRTWQTARWTGKDWEHRRVLTSDNNYDFGSLYVEEDGTWRIIAPTEPGPQRYNPGGEMALWISRDQGKTWKKEKDLTANSPHNHTYARRPVNAHPDFYALWADGHARQPSVSHLYFANKSGDRVCRLPPVMKEELARPEVVARTAPASELRVVADFPGGSARVESIDAKSQTIRIAPTPHQDRGWICWWYFKVEGVRPGQTLTVEVKGSGFTTPDRAMFSLDHRHWQHTAPGERQKERTVYRQRVDGTEAWFAWGPPFVGQHAQGLIDEAARKHAHVRKMVLCQSKEGRPVPGLRIEQPGTPERERLGIWIQARQHAWESGSSWVCEGLLSWLLSEDPRAEALRKKATITVIPIMDLDNVERGAGGKNQKPHDHNRDWSDQAVWPEVREAMKQIATMNTAGQFDLFIDLHNPAPGDRQPFFFVPAPELLSPRGRGNQQAFLDAARLEMTGPLKLAPQPRESGKNYDPNWQRISTNWITRNTRDHVVAVCLETSWNTPQSTQAGYRQIGRELGLAVERYLRQSPRERKP